LKQKKEKFTFIVNNPTSQAPVLVAATAVAKMTQRSRAHAVEPAIANSSSSKKALVVTASNCDNSFCS
jgi:hypothetical protein